LLKLSDVTRAGDIASNQDSRDNESLGRLPSVLEHAPPHGIVERRIAAAARSIAAEVNVG
jgi:hypothetical protein